MYEDLLRFFRLGCGGVIIEELFACLDVARVGQNRYSRVHLAGDCCLPVVLPTARSSTQPQLIHIYVMYTFLLVGIYTFSHSLYLYVLHISTVYTFLHFCILHIATSLFTITAFLHFYISTLTSDYLCTFLYFYWYKLTPLHISTQLFVL